MDMKTEMFKYLAFFAAGIYVFKKFQSDPQSLGDPSRLEIRAHSIIDKGLGNMNLHPAFKSKLGVAMKNYASQEINSKIGNVRDVN